MLVSHVIELWTNTRMMSKHYTFFLSKKQMHKLYKLKICCTIIKNAIRYSQMLSDPSCCKKCSGRNNEEKCWSKGISVLRYEHFPWPITNQPSISISRSFNRRSAWYVEIDNWSYGKIFWGKKVMPEMCKRFFKFGKCCVPWNLIF